VKVQTSGRLGRETYEVKSLLIAGYQAKTESCLDHPVSNRIPGQTFPIFVGSGARVRGSCPHLREKTPLRRVAVPDVFLRFECTFGGRRFSIETRVCGRYSSRICVCSSLGRVMPVRRCYRALTLPLSPFRIVRFDCIRGSVLAPPRNVAESAGGKNTASTRNFITPRAGLCATG
jgi:hypothetical protein